MKFYAGVAYALITKCARARRRTDLRRVFADRTRKRFTSLSRSADFNIQRDETARLRNRRCETPGNSIIMHVNKARDMPQDDTGDRGRRAVSKFRSERLRHAARCARRCVSETRPGHGMSYRSAMPIAHFP